MTYRAEIVAAAVKHGLDPDLVQSVVEQESAGHFHAYRFEPEFFTRYLADSPEWKRREPREVAASFGLMQPLYVTAVEHGFDGEPWDLFNPVKNLDIGCKILAARFAWARSFARSGRINPVRILQSALASYNGGKGGNSPTSVPLRNQQYAKEVLARYERIRSQRA